MTHDICALLRPLLNSPFCYPNFLVKKKVNICTLYQQRRRIPTISHKIKTQFSRGIFVYGCYFMTFFSSEAEEGNSYKPHPMTIPTWVPTMQSFRKRAIFRETRRQSSHHLAMITRWLTTKRNSSYFKLWTYA